MRSYQITIRGRRFIVHLLSDPRQEQVQVEVDGEALTVEIEVVPDVEDGSQAPADSGSSFTPIAQQMGPAAQLVVAPLPGTVKSIAVQPGQGVAVGDELLVIEAMKMNNVIRASRAGIIDTVHVGEGRQVAHGEPILEYRQ
jgi:biotin carboxyl carrier protein